MREAKLSSSMQVDLAAVVSRYMSLRRFCRGEGGDETRGPTLKKA